MVRVDMAAEQVMDMRLEQGTGMHILEADVNSLRNNAVSLFYSGTGFESSLGEFLMDSKVFLI